MTHFDNHFRDLARDHPGTSTDQVPLIVRLDDMQISARDVYNTHHDFVALYIVRTGRGIHIIDGVPHGVSRGDVYVLPAGATHAYSQHDELKLDAIYFQPVLLEALDPDPLTFSGRWLHLVPGTYHAIRDEIEEIRREWQAGTNESSLLVRCLFARLWIHLRRLSELPDTRIGHKREDREWLVSRAVRHLDEHFGEDIRIASLASTLSVSEDRLGKAFSESMGRTPSDYLRHVRVERAKHLLNTTDLTAAEIGLRVGYYDPSHFNRVFRATENCPPKAYRDRRRSQTSG